MQGGRRREQAADLISRAHHLITCVHCNAHCSSNPASAWSASSESPTQLSTVHGSTITDGCTFSITITQRTWSDSNNIMVIPLQT